MLWPLSLPEKLRSCRAVRWNRDMRTVSLPISLLVMSLLSVGCHTPSTYYPVGLLVFLNEDQLADVPPAEPGQTAETAPVVERPSVVTLPDAVQACVLANLLIQAGREEVQQAR